MIVKRLKSSIFWKKKAKCIIFKSRTCTNSLWVVSGLFVGKLKSIYHVCMIFTFSSKVR